MITTPTVFVLGAGSSVPYAFPTGAGLIERIQAPSVLDAICRELGLPPAHLEDFRRQLTLSSRESIDAFLEHRPEFAPIGKLAIASVLRPCESSLGNGLFAGNRRGHWLRWLFNRMSATFDDFAKNKVAIVSFNYDRLLEHFFVNALSAAYGAPIKKCESTLRSLPVVRVYGSLGEYEDAAFRRASSRPELARAAESINVVSEGECDPGSFEKAIGLLQRADRAVFLGFGFGGENCERLKIRSWIESTTVLGSAYGLAEAEREVARVSFCHRIQLGHPEHDCLAFLRESFVP